MLNRMIIDTHCHLDYDRLSEDLDEVVGRAEHAGVERMISIGCDLKTSRAAVELTGRFESVYATVGLHPCYVESFEEGVFEEFEGIIESNEKIVAVGECGLDFYKGDVSDEGRKLQREVFEAQIDLARRMNLPLVIHNRQADEDCFEILNEAEAERVVFHCYGSDLDFARKIWDKGWITSFTGIVTYPNARDLQEVAKEVPMDLFMVETDAPFLAPQSKRGQRNEPAYVAEVIKKISELKELSMEEVVRVSTENAKRFFARLG